MNILSKKSKTIFGWIAFLSSLALFGLSIYMYLKPLLDVDLAKIQNGAILNCQTNARNAGFVVMSEKISNGEPQEPTIYRDTLSDWDEWLLKSSYLIESCRGLELKKFCMGHTCEDTARNRSLEGLIMNMRYSGPLTGRSVTAVAPPPKAVEKSKPGKNK